MKPAVIVESPEYVTHYNEVTRQLQDALDSAGMLIQWQVLEYDEHMAMQLRTRDGTPEKREEMKDLLTVVFRLRLGGDWLRGSSLISMELFDDDPKVTIDCLFRQAMGVIEYAIRRPGSVSR